MITVKTNDHYHHGLMIMITTFTIIKLVCSLFYKQKKAKLVSIFCTHTQLVNIVTILDS